MQCAFLFALTHDNTMLLSFYILYSIVTADCAFVPRPNDNVRPLEKKFEKKNGLLRKGG